tara:strand:- start:1184 stop:2119 length:936 start_codon:yes stop_codon:yes gene_type:complete
MPQPTIQTTYAGEFAGKYVSAALLTGNTIANGLIEVKPNIKFKEVLKRIDLSGAIANATCDFTTAGTVALTEKIIEPKELQVNLELCKTPFQSDWEAESMGYSAHDNLPKTFSDYFIGLMAEQIAEQTETDIWSGAAGAGTFDGFKTLLNADAGHTGAKKIVGEAITSTNVVAQLSLVEAQISDSVYDKEDLFIYASQNVFRAYKSSLGGFQANGQGGNGYMSQGSNQDIDVQYFNGVKIVACNGLADNNIIVSQKSNLFFGTGLLSDHNEVKVLDMADLDGSKNVRFIMRYTAGVQYAVVDNIVSYGLGL